MSFFRFLISRTFLINISAMILILAALIWGVLKFLDNYTHHGEAITLPDFTGQSLEELKAATGEKELRYNIIDSVFSDSQPKGTVVNQNPKAGSKVKRNRMIYITINATQPEMVTLPVVKTADGSEKLAFVQIDKRTAIAKLESYGLKAEIELIDGDFKDFVGSAAYNGEELKPGDRIEKGSMITLNVQKGTGGAAVPLPNLIGKSYSEAKQILAEISVSIFPRPDDPENIKKPDYQGAKIFQQYPNYKKGVKIESGSTVTVMLTKDPEKLKNPGKASPDGSTNPPE